VISTPYLFSSLAFTAILLAQLPTNVISLGGSNATFHFVSSTGSGNGNGISTPVSRHFRDASRGCWGSMEGKDFIKEWRVNKNRSSECTYSWRFGPNIWKKRFNLVFVSQLLCYSNVTYLKLEWTGFEQFTGLLYIPWVIFGRWLHPLKFSGGPATPIQYIQTNQIKDLGLDEAYNNIGRHGPLGPSESCLFRQWPSWQFCRLLCHNLPLTNLCSNCSGWKNSNDRLDVVFFFFTV